jgi:hypothetical protein
LNQAKIPQGNIELQYMKQKRWEGRWVAKLVARLLAKTALWVRNQVSRKNTRRVGGLLFHRLTFQGFFSSTYKKNPSIFVSQKEG